MSWCEVRLGNTCIGQPCNRLPQVRSRDLQVKNKASIPPIWTKQAIKLNIYCNRSFETLPIN